MSGGGKNPRTSPACKNTASCAGPAPKPPQGLPAGSRRPTVALASVGWLRVELFHAGRAPHDEPARREFACVSTYAFGDGPRFGSAEERIGTIRASPMS